MLNIIGFVFIIVFTIFAYKTAKEYDRSPIGWALISFSVGFSLQIILPVLIIILFAILMRLNGISIEQQRETIPIVTISVICILLSIVSGFLIVRHLAKLPEEHSLLPPPPNF